MSSSPTAEAFWHDQCRKLVRVLDRLSVSSSWSYQDIKVYLKRNSMDNRLVLRILSCVPEGFCCVEFAKRILAELATIDHSSGDLFSFVRELPFDPKDFARVTGSLSAWLSPPSGSSESSEESEVVYGSTSGNTLPHPANLMLQKQFSNTNEAAFALVSTMSHFHGQFVSIVEPLGNDPVLLKAIPGLATYLARQAIANHTTMEGLAAAMSHNGALLARARAKSKRGRPSVADASLSRLRKLTRLPGAPIHGVEDIPTPSQGELLASAAGSAARMEMSAEDRMLQRVLVWTQNAMLLARRLKVCHTPGYQLLVKAIEQCGVLKTSAKRDRFLRVLSNDHETKPWSNRSISREDARLRASAFDIAPPTAGIFPQFAWVKPSGSHLTDFEGEILRDQPRGLQSGYFACTLCNQTVHGFANSGSNRLQNCIAHARQQKHVIALTKWWAQHLNSLRAASSASIRMNAPTPVQLSSKMSQLTLRSTTTPLDMSRRIFCAGLSSAVVSAFLELDARGLFRMTDSQRMNLTSVLPNLTHFIEHRVLHSINDVTPRKEFSWLSDGSASSRSSLLAVDMVLKSRRGGIRAAHLKDICVEYLASDGTILGGVVPLVTVCDQNCSGESTVLSVPTSAQNLGQLPHMCAECCEQLFNSSSDLHRLLADFVERRSRVEQVSAAMGSQWIALQKEYEALPRGELLQILHKLQADLDALEVDISLFGSVERLGEFRALRGRFQKFVGAVHSREGSASSLAKPSHRLFVEQAWRSSGEAVSQAMMHLGNFMLCGSSSWHYISCSAMIPGLPSLTSIKRFRAKDMSFCDVIVFGLRPSTLDRIGLFEARIQNLQVQAAEGIQDTQEEMVEGAKSNKSEEMSSPATRRVQDVFNDFDLDFSPIHAPATPFWIVAIDGTRVLASQHADFGQDCADGHLFGLCMHPLPNHFSHKKWAHGVPIPPGADFSKLVAALTAVIGVHDPETLLATSKELEVAMISAAGLDSAEFNSPSESGNVVRPEVLWMSPVVPRGKSCAVEIHCLLALLSGLLQMQELPLAVLMDNASTQLQAMHQLMDRSNVRAGEPVVGIASMPGAHEPYVLRSTFRGRPGVMMCPDVDHVARLLFRQIFFERRRTMIGVLKEPGSPSNLQLFQQFHRRARQLAVLGDTLKLSDSQIKEILLSSYVDADIVQLFFSFDTLRLMKQCMEDDAKWMHHSKRLRLTIEAGALMFTTFWRPDTLTVSEAVSNLFAGRHLFRILDAMCLLGQTRRLRSPHGDADANSFTAPVAKAIELLVSCGYLTYLRFCSRPDFVRQGNSVALFCHVLSRMTSRAVEGFFGCVRTNAAASLQGACGNWLKTFQAIRRVAYMRESQSVLEAHEIPLQPPRKYKLREAQLSRLNANANTGFSNDPSICADNLLSWRTEGKMNAAERLRIIVGDDKLKALFTNVQLEIIRDTPWLFGLGADGTTQTEQGDVRSWHAPCEFVYDVGDPLACDWKWPSGLNLGSELAQDWEAARNLGVWDEKAADGVIAAIVAGKDTRLPMCDEGYGSDDSDDVEWRETRRPIGGTNAHSDSDLYVWSRQFAEQAAVLVKERQGPTSARKFRPGVFATPLVALPAVVAQQAADTALMQQAGQNATDAPDVPPSSKTASGAGDTRGPLSAWLQASPAAVNDAADTTEICSEPQPSLQQNLPDDIARKLNSAITRFVAKQVQLKSKRVLGQLKSLKPESALFKAVAAMRRILLLPQHCLPQHANSCYLVSVVSALCGDPHFWLRVMAALLGSNREDRSLISFFAVHVALIKLLGYMHGGCLKRLKWVLASVRAYCQEATSLMLGALEIATLEEDYLQEAQSVKRALERERLSATETRWLLFVRRMKTWWCSCGIQCKNSATSEATTGVNWTPNDVGGFMKDLFEAVKRRSTAVAALDVWGCLHSSPEFFTALVGGIEKESNFETPLFGHKLVNLVSCGALGDWHTLFCAASLYQHSAQEFCVLSCSEYLPGKQPLCWQHEQTVDKRFVIPAGFEQPDGPSARLDKLLKRQTTQMLWRPVESCHHAKQLKATASRDVPTFSAAVSAVECLSEGIAVSVERCIYVDGVPAVVKRRVTQLSKIGVTSLVHSGQASEEDKVDFLANAACLRYGNPACGHYTSHRATPWGALLTDSMARPGKAILGEIDASAGSAGLDCSSSLSGVRLTGANPFAATSKPGKHSSEFAELVLFSSQDAWHDQEVQLAASSQDWIALGLDSDLMSPLLQKMQECLCCLVGYEYD